MKRRNSPELIIVYVVIAVLVIALAVSVTLFMMALLADMEDDNVIPPDTTTATEKPTEKPTKDKMSDAFDVGSMGTEIPEEIESSTEQKTFNADVTRVWIGDSRMVGLSKCKLVDAYKDLFIAKGAMAFDWFAGVGAYEGEGAVDQLREYLDSGRPYDVIIQMGINDCANNLIGWTDYTVEDYISLINTLSWEYPRATFYFISVGQNVGNYGASHGRLLPPSLLNPLATEFNYQMYYRCNAIYLAVGEQIAEQEMSYGDGVHYSSSTNRWIYQYVIEKLKTREPDVFMPYPEETEEESDTDEYEVDPDGTLDPDDIWYDPYGTEEDSEATTSAALG